MSKLPTDFVKAPAAQPKAKPRRQRKASMISTEPARDPKEIVLQLSDDEYKALEEARHALHQAGSEVTLEQMIHRVFAEWMVRLRAPVQTNEATVEATTGTAAPRDERLHARLREFLAAPLQMWRQLATQLWRASLLGRRLRRAT